MAGTVIVPVVRDGLPRQRLRGGAWTRSRRSPLRYGATSYAVYRSRDDKYKFQQFATFESTSTGNATGKAPR